MHFKIELCIRVWVPLIKDSYSAMSMTSLFRSHLEGEYCNESHLSALKAPQTNECDFGTPLTQEALAAFSRYRKHIQRGCSASVLCSSSLKQTTALHSPPN